MNLPIVSVLGFAWIALSMTAQAAVLDGRYILSAVFRGEQQMNVIEFFPDGKCVVDDTTPGAYHIYADRRLLLEFSGPGASGKAKVYTHDRSGEVLTLTAAGKPPDYYVRQPAASALRVADLVGMFTRQREVGETIIHAVYDHAVDGTFRAQFRYMSTKTKTVVLECSAEGTWDYSAGILTAHVLKTTDPRPRKATEMRGAAIRRDSEGLWIIDGVTGQERVMSPAASFTLPLLPVGFSPAE